MTLSARLARPDECGLVTAITGEAYAEYLPLLGQPPLPITEDYGPRIQAGQVWLVSRELEVVGAEVLEVHADHLAIFSLAVRPGARGGIGRWMLEFAEARAGAEGVDEVRLYTNARMVRNIGIYAQAGYVETGRQENAARPGWVFVHMAKRLGGRCQRL